MDDKISLLEMIARSINPAEKILHELLEPSRKYMTRLTLI